MTTKQRSTRIITWSLLTCCLLLLLVSPSIADEPPKQKGIFGKILGRFKKKQKAVVDEKVTKEPAGAVNIAAVEESSDGNKVCTSDDQSCQASNDIAEEITSEDGVDETPTEDSVAASDKKDTQAEEPSNEEKTDIAQPEESSNDNAAAAPEQNQSEPNNEEPQCIDLHANCATWAAQVDPETNLTPCTTHSAYMQQMCPVSCDTCILVEIDTQLRKLSKMIGQEGRIHPHCSDDQFDCVTWAKAGECESNTEYMHLMCRDSCGLCSAKSNFFGSGQRTVNGKSQELALTKSRIDDTAKYMHMVNNDSEYKNVRSRCLNRDKDCAFWWAVGECTINADYMNMFCAPTCHTCHMIPGFGAE